MAGLNTWQKVIAKDTIYKIERNTASFESVSPNIFIDGGEATIYTSEKTPANVGEMFEEETQITGHNAFLITPNYIYVTETTPTINEIVLTGFKDPVAVI